MKNKNIKTTNDQYKLFITEDEQNFLDGVRKERNEEAKIEKLDGFFNTKSSAFGNKIYVSINNCMFEEWVIEIKTETNKTNKTIYTLKHRNTKGETEKFHKDKAFDRMDYCYLYISNHNKKLIEKKNPLKNHSKFSKVDRMTYLFSII
jgi:hypothetical protein